MKLTPNDPNVQLQLGQSAQAANDTATAIAAYKKFLKLAPHDPLASNVEAAAGVPRSHRGGEHRPPSRLTRQFELPT